MENSNHNQKPDGQLKIGSLYNQRGATLVDVLDRVVEKGAYIRGEAMLNVADVEMIYVGLQLMVSSVSRLEKSGTKASGRIASGQDQAYKDKAYIEALENQLKAIEVSIPKLMEAASASEVEQGIAKLVLTLVEAIRQLLEREAIRRIDQGNLSETEIQKLALTFQTLEKKIQQLKAIFGIREDLNINLGPLGKVL